MSHYALLPDFTPRFHFSYFLVREIKPITRT